MSQQMNAKSEKEKLRAELAPETGGSGKFRTGKIAEILRGSKIYKNALRVYCGPSILLKQIRINSLLDGKELVMPGPGMKEGFFLIKPFTVPFKKMALAVTYKKLGKYGKRLDNRDLKRLGLELLIDHVELTDRSGYFLGDGKGFFDLALAVLADTGGLAGGFQVVVAVDDSEKIIDELPRDPWDVQSNTVLTPSGIETLSAGRERPRIIWEELEMDRIKRVSPLWKHYVATREKR